MERTPDRTVEAMMPGVVSVHTLNISVNDERSHHEMSRPDGFPEMDGCGNLISGPAPQVLDPSPASVAAVNLPRSHPCVIDANDPDSVLSEAKPRMIVLLSDGTRVGIIDGIRVDDAGKRTSIVVLHGRLMKRKTLVDGKLVDFVDDDLVILSIDSQTFKSLRDVQPSSPRTRV